MTPSIPDAIRRKLRRFKTLLRIYAGIDGITNVLFALILLIVGDFLLDRFFEFPRVLRCMLLPVFFSGLLYLIAKQIIFRCFTRFKPDQIAAVFERYVPHLNETLFTAISRHQNNNGHVEDVGAELLQETTNEALNALQGIRICRFLRTGRFAVRFFFALFLAAMPAVFYWESTELASLWFSRNILLSSQEYPRRSELLIDGFSAGKIRIARGDSLTLSVRANTDKPLVPDTIRLRLGTPDTGYRTLQIDQFHTETREGIRWRVFSADFPEMLETVMLQISGADTTLNDLCIEVVPPPTFAGITLRQKFPNYIQRPERTISLTGRTSVPDGTEITLSATATKSLRKVVATVNGMESIPTLRNEDLIELSLPTVREETVIEFQLTDTDSLTNRQPIRAEIGIIKDQPPIVTARLEGIGSAITPEAELPVVGEITDDYALTNAMYRYSTEPINTEPMNTEESVIREPLSGTVPISGLAADQTVFPLAQPFAVSPLGVSAGDKLNLSVEASDAFTLDSSQGQIGTGQRFQLEIVTPEQLKTLLETREIALRQRFEVVLGEVERTKNILTEYTLEPLPQQLTEADALTLDEIENETSAERELRRRDLELKKQQLRDTILPEQAELGAYHISRMLRDTQKESFDLNGIVESFRGVRSEMINNRIFTEDERRRIDQEIMQPMQELTNSDFLEGDRLMNELNRRLAERSVPNRPLVLSDRQNVLDQFDRTILKMQSIRDKMASMESYNEAVELLRLIIKQQQQLRQETIEEKNKRLRDLLE